MDSSYCTGAECFDYCQNDYESVVQTELDSPMPWVGMYIAAASMACTLAMAVDALRGFRSKTFWFPCKYFCLNAFSLTLLSVAMKLPVDLTNKLMGVFDKLARVSSLVLMSTAMGNFMTSLGSLENSEIALNLVALCILVVTIAANVCIHMAQMRYFLNSLEIMAEEIGSTVFMILLVVTSCSSAIMVPTAKKNMESVYLEMHTRVSNKIFTIDELRTAVTRYWVTAQTGNPQFVIARSATCATSGLFINWILLIQSIGVTLGTIAPLFRWFIAAKVKGPMIGRKCFKDEFKVESYWTQRLVDWRDSPLPLQIRHHSVKKALHDAKRLFLNFCIWAQVVIVLASKSVLLISATCAKVIFFCFHHIYNLKACGSEESGPTMELDFSCYVVLLEGEAQLPKKILRKICNEVYKLIQSGKKKQPKNLIRLLHKSVNFNGVREFDSKQIQSLLSFQEPPNCWSLPIVTLTSIAIALPNIAAHKSDKLLRSVDEGLYFVKLIEKAINRNGELASINDAAYVVWVGVELYHKWQDKDIREISLKSQSYKNTLQELSDMAKKIVANMETDMGDFLIENPLTWPVKVVAANSMYRISQTILLAYNDNDSQTEDELFERLLLALNYF